MKTLVIDNIDSFVYNLVQYIGILGGNPVVVQNNINFSRINEIIKKEKITHIVISPGPKTPKDAKISNKVIERFGSEIPILGVCLGHQCIGHVYGAEIVKAKNLMHGKTSFIKHNNKGILKGLENPLTATRYHSLIISRENFPKSLEIIAESLDDKEIMGVKHKKYLIYGLQFHPESILTKNGLKIIENFLEVEK